MAVNARLLRIRSLWKRTVWFLLCHSHDQGIVHQPVPSQPDDVPIDSRLEMTGCVCVCVCVCVCLSGWGACRQGVSWMRSWSLRLHIIDGTPGGRAGETAGGMVVGTSSHT